MSPDQFRAGVRDRLEELIQGETEDYLGSGARLRELRLDGPNGNLKVVFTDPSRPGQLQAWQWAFPGLPPADYVPTVEGAHSYAGWVAVCFLEARVTRRGLTSVPE